MGKNQEASEDIENNNSDSNQRKTLVFFDNPDNVPMHFVVICRKAVDSSRMCRMIERHGGRASVNIADCGPHSAVLVEEGVDTRMLTRCFKTSYIKDCLKIGRILNISHYLIKDAENDQRKNVDYFSIVYYRDSSWLDLSQTSRSKSSEKQRLETEINKPGPSAGAVEVTRRPKNAANARINSNDDSEFEIEVDEDLRQSTRSVRQERIIYISDDSESSIEITEATRQQKIRKVGCDSSTEEDIRPSETCNGNRNHKSSSSSNVQANSPRQRRKSPVIDEDSDTDSTFERMEVQQPVCKQPKREYSRREKEAIVKYIVDNNLFHSVGGVSMWKEMERKKVLPERTWQSVKEHFRRVIVREINRYSFLTPHQKRKLIVPPNKRYR